MCVCVQDYLPGAGGDLCEFAQSPEGVAPVHVIQGLGAVPQQAEAHGVLAAGGMLVMLVVGPQLVLHDPGRRDEAETADGDQSGGEEHPEAAHTAEHGSSSGQKARRQTQIDAEPDFFFFLLPAQERMHLPSRARLQVQAPVQHYMSKRGSTVTGPRQLQQQCGCVSPEHLVWRINYKDRSGMSDGDIIKSGHPRRRTQVGVESNVTRKIFFFTPQTAGDTQVEVKEQLKSKLKAETQTYPAAALLFFPTGILPPPHTAESVSLWRQVNARYRGNFLVGFSK